ncbi:MAG: S-methyl-5-thioribose-1-phosphate isomerase [Planctomycetota bacterium]|nr:MAG: S-methyl-5-thioribose-1-phosphate isomerase [Planctomycetota bacterium]
MESLQLDLGFRTLDWVGELPGHVQMLEQSLLPDQEIQLRVEDVPTMVAAIQRLAVRGAPALGCAGAYGVILGIQGSSEESPESWLQKLREVSRTVAEARPTAVNLSIGVKRVQELGERLAAAGEGQPADWNARLLQEALAFHREDEELCLAIGRHGAALLGPAPVVLTHCNAGALATGGTGTALSVVYAAKAMGKEVSVFADETRPLLQGARLTAWELHRAGIPVTVQCDGAAASTLASGRIDAVVVGSDRIAANGDVANKIGTYPLAVLAREHGVPFYVAAPTTTVDMHCPSGGDIPIEQRAAEEVFGYQERLWAAKGVEAWNPAFDVTPAKWVTAIITERGVVEAPTASKMADHMAD